MSEIDLSRPGRGSGCVEIRFDFGRKTGQGCSHVFRNGRRLPPGLSIPKAAHACPDMFLPHHVAKLVDAIGIAWLRIKKLYDPP